jgi:hypothetical protein
VSTAEAIMQADHSAPKAPKSAAMEGGKGVRPPPPPPPPLAHPEHPAGSVLLKVYGEVAEALKLSEVVEVTGVLCNVPDGSTLTPHEEEWMAEEHAATQPPMSQVCGCRAFFFIATHRCGLL